MILQQRIENFWDAVIRKDLESIATAYIPSDSTYVILEGPRYSTIGFQKIMKGWKDFCGSSIDMEGYAWVEGPQEETGDQLGWIGGITDLSIRVSGKIFTTRFRISFVMKLFEEDWKIRHEHVSAPLADPYGVGDWLKK